MQLPADNDVLGLAVKFIGFDRIMTEHKVAASGAEKNKWPRRKVKRKRHKEKSVKEHFKDDQGSSPKEEDKQNEKQKERS